MSEEKKILLTKTDQERWVFTIYTGPGDKWYGSFVYSPVSYADFEMLIELTEEEKQKAIQNRDFLLNLSEQIRNNHKEWLHKRALDASLYSTDDKTDLSAIRKAFADYFEQEHELPENIPAKGSISSLDTGWMIRYILSTDEYGRLYLDLTADHRMTNPRHIRIDANGDISSLETYMESFSYDEDIPGDEERQRQAFYEHNRKVGRILFEKGLSDDDPEE